MQNAKIINLGSLQGSKWGGNTVHQRNKVYSIKGVSPCLCGLESPINAPAIVLKRSTYEKRK